MGAGAESHVRNASWQLSHARATHTLQVGPGSCVERVLGGLSRKRRAAAAAAAWVVTFAPRAISHNPSMQCKSWSLSRARTWSSGESKTFISRETPSQGSAMRCLMIRSTLRPLYMRCQSSTATIQKSALAGCWSTLSQPSPSFRCSPPGIELAHQR